MADQDSLNNANGGGEDSSAPHAAALAQYVKDLSVECPNSPQVFQWQEQPRVDVGFGIQPNRISDDVHEVVIKLDVSAQSDRGVQFMIELSYGGLFAIRNLPEEAIGPFLLIEAPRLLFPFARQIVAEATQQTGFPPLLLDPINFEAAYLAQVQGQQGEAGALGSGTGNGDGNGDGGGEGPESPGGSTGQG
ncbi:MAG: protein-export chaperone SecB [Sphingomonas sp.]|nr:protein-export chaperone SecB [Sphingomonas sp.]